MSDENINPQNIPIQSQGPNLADQKFPSLNSKKTIIVFLLIVLTIGIPVSLFWFFNQTKQNTKPSTAPTATPKTTGIPLPTQAANEFIISLKLRETILIPNTSISITYISADIPGENCYDCIASNTLEVKKNNQIKVLDYSCGGFSGECIVKQEAYDYEIEIIDSPSKDTLKLKAHKR